MDWDYSVPGVLLLPLLEHLQVVVVPLDLLVPLLEHLQVGWVPAVLVVTLGVDYGDDGENLLLNLLSLSLLLQQL